MNIQIVTLLEKIITCIAIAFQPHATEDDDKAIKLMLTRIRTLQYEEAVRGTCTIQFQNLKFVRKQMENMIFKVT